MDFSSILGILVAVLGIALAVKVTKLVFKVALIIVALFIGYQFLF